MHEIQTTTLFIYNPCYYYIRKFIGTDVCSNSQNFSNKFAQLFKILFILQNIWSNNIQIPFSSPLLKKSTFLYKIFLRVYTLFFTNTIFLHKIVG